MDINIIFWGEEESKFGTDYYRLDLWEEENDENQLK